jgi:CxxH/CxxC protein (TIGR04129 family)
MKMKIYSCETHINHALDVFVAEEGKFPIMELLSDEEKLSTNCTYCEETALYLVANE